MEHIAIDRQLFKTCHRIFTSSRRLVPRYDKGLEIDGSEKRCRVYRLPGARAIELRFYVDRFAPWNVLTPTLGRRGSEILAGLICRAKENECLSGEFRLRNMALFLKNDPPESGRYYSDIRRTFFSLATVRVRLQTSGGTSRDLSFCDDWAYDPKTKIFRYTLNREVLGVTACWIEGTLDRDNMGGGYIKYPLSFIKARLTESEKAFRDYLLTLRNTVTARAFTIARDWCGFGEDILGRRLALHEQLYAFLRNAEDRGDILSWKPSPFGFASWKTEWKITITRPRQKRRQLTRVPQQLSEAEQELIREIVEWQSRPVHGLRWSGEEIRERVTNTVLTYGYTAIRKLYSEQGCGAYPSIDGFWKGVQGLKQARSRSTDTLAQADVSSTSLPHK